MNHFDFPELVYSDNIAYINMMRDPLDRFVSEYYYMRLSRRGKRGKQYRLDHGNLTLEECLFGSHNFTGKCLPTFNKMAHYFCGMESGVCHEKEDMLMKSSQHNLESVYTVGLIEELHDSLRMLEIKFPRFFRGLSSINTMR